jgi:hypothetical protein
MDGNLTLLEVEKISKNENFIFDRDMSIRNLNKTLFELQKNLSNKNSHLTFKLLHISDKLIKDLEESEINFINIGGESCYQSSTLQGFVHFLFPLAIKNINIERKKRKLEKVLDLDELKNNDIFNNTVIDTLKGIIKIQGCGKGGVDENGQKGYLASKLFEIAPPEYKGGQGQENTADINKNHNKTVNHSKKYLEALKAQKDFLKFGEANPPRRIGDKLWGAMFTGQDLINVIEIKNDTIISEIMKFKIEGNNKYFGNLVLKFNQNNLNDPYLDIYKLLKNCPQLKKNEYSCKKITETSDVLFMITDRISSNVLNIKNFKLYEEIYLDNNGYFVDHFPYSIIFELKFVIYHHYYSKGYGHFVAYVKIKGEWYLFNDCSDDYAEKSIPPLIQNFKEKYYPMCFYYVKKK